MFLRLWCPINCIASKVFPICSAASDKFTQINLSDVNAIPAATPNAMNPSTQPPATPASGTVRCPPGGEPDCTRAGDPGPAGGGGPLLGDLRGEDLQRHLRAAPGGIADQLPVLGRDDHRADEAGMGEADPQRRPLAGDHHPVEVDAAAARAPVLVEGVEIGRAHV